MMGSGKAFLQKMTSDVLSILRVTKCIFTRAPRKAEMRREEVDKPPMFIKTRHLQRRM